MIISFVRNRQYLIPREDQDMKALLTLNLRLTRYDVDYLPTLKLIAEAKGYSIEVSDFSPIIEDLFTRLENWWTASADQTFKYEKNRIKLLGPNNPSIVRKLQNLENKLLSFFERWGYETNFIPSQSKTRASLTIDYSLSRDKVPVITIDDAEHELDFDPAILQFGKQRIIISRRANSYGYAFQEYVNGDWHDVRSQSKINMNELKSSHFITTLFEMFNIQSLK